jgi:hypothetical protein
MLKKNIQNSFILLFIKKKIVFTHILQNVFVNDFGHKGIMYMVLNENIASLPKSSHFKDPLDGARTWQ